MAIVAFGAIQAARAASLGREGRAALLRAERHLSLRDLDPARNELTSAHGSFQRMGSQLDRLGPVMSVARIVPVLRSQVLAVEALQDAGATVSLAGQRLADAAQNALRSSEDNVPLSGATERLRTIHSSLGSGMVSLREAEAEVSRLEGRWLIGPVGDAYDEFSERLGDVVERASSAERGMAALIDFTGGNGPRRYLFLSQNPDEIRPTGGFMGMFGVLGANSGEFDLQLFEPITEFTRRHPGVEIPGARAGSPFQFSQPPRPQRLGNVNNLPDWPRSAQLAMDLWERAGEEPIDGVASFTPAFLAGLLSVLGPVSVESYGETVTAENLIERFDFYTEREEAGEGEAGEKKGFVAELGDLVFGRLIQVPSSQWARLAGVVGDGFAAREAMAWAKDPEVGKTLAERGWDGAFPQVAGDFFYNGEFSYAAKNGRGLRRTFDHEVALRPNGSALITTTMRTANTEDPGLYNPGSLSYVTIYGPEGATLEPASDPPYSPEPALAGHPAVGYFLSATAGGEVTVRVVWEVANLVRRDGDGDRRYSLLWRRVPDHSGDVLNLRVTLPGGWSWKGNGPPSKVELKEDLRGSWEIDTG